MAAVSECVTRKLLWISCRRWSREQLHLLLLVLLPPLKAGSPGWPLLPTVRTIIFLVTCSDVWAPQSETLFV